MAVTKMENIQTENRFSGNTSDFTEGLVRALVWIPRCEYCGTLSTHKQTWSDRLPVFYCDKPECDKRAKECYDTDLKCDQIDFRRGECLWAETSRFLTDNAPLQRSV